MAVDLDPKILWSLLGVFTLIFVKTLLAWILAFKEGKFDIREAPRFLVTNVLPYVAALAALALPSLWQPEVKAVFFSGAGLVALKYLAEIKDRFQALFEVKLPETPSQ